MLVERDMTLLRLEMLPLAPTEERLRWWYCFLRFVGEGEPPAREEMDPLEIEDDREVFEPIEEEMDERLATELRLVLRYDLS